MTLDELTAKVEALQGPNDGVDCEIAAAIGWRQLVIVYGPSANHWVSPKDWLAKSCMDGWSSQPNAPAFTSSLDAAVTLVPEGWSWKLLHEPKYVDIYRVVLRHAPELAEFAFSVVESRRTPAISLTAAALRARASSLSNGTRATPADIPTQGEK